MTKAKTETDPALTTSVDLTNLYSLMYASAGDCTSMLEYDVPDIGERGGGVKWVVERTAYIRDRVTRMLEPLRAQIVSDVIARTPPELMPEIYHRPHDTVPFRIKEGQSCPLARFEVKVSFVKREEAERAHAGGAIILEEKGSDHFEIYSPELTEHLLLDWRRAPKGDITFTTCCIFKAHERWYVLEAPGEGDEYGEDEIKSLLYEDERALYEECVAADRH